MLGRSVSVIIANWDGRHLLERFLPLVLCALREQDEVIIVDNGSRDGSLEWLRERFACVRVVALPKNYGFSVANNIGVKVARGEIVVLLNNDMAPERGFLEPMLRHFDDPMVFAVGAKLLHPNGGCVDANRTRLLLVNGLLMFTGEWDMERLRRCRQHEEQALAQGGGSAFDREKFLALGGFDSIFSPAHAEDFDLCLRAWLRGWRILYEPDSIVWHLGRQTTRRSALQFLRLASAHLWLFNLLHAPTFWWLGWQCKTILQQLIGEVLSGEPFIVRWGMLRLLQRWWGIAKRRWLIPPPSPFQMAALLQRLYPHELLTDLPATLPPLPPNEFVLLLMPVLDGAFEIVKEAAQAARERWGLPVAVIARPQQAENLQKEGVADFILTFWAGVQNSHFGSYGQLLRWLQQAPCRVAVYVPEIRSASKFRFLLLGFLLCCPLWEWRQGQWRRLRRWVLTIGFAWRAMTALIWFWLGLLWAGAMLMAEVLAALLRRIVPKGAAGQ